MRKIVKKLSLAVCLVTASLLCATVYGAERLPDQVTTCHDGVRFSFLYSVKREEPVISASAAADTEQTDATIRLLDAIPVKTVSLNRTQRRYVSLGGELIGITMKTDGILVVGSESFSSGGSSVCPAKEAGLMTGDVIQKVNGRPVADNNEFLSLIENSGGTGLTVEYARDGRITQTTLTPRTSELTGNYKCGLWIRDCTNGIGTLTYTDPEMGTIASLGHGIYDVDTEALLPSSEGEFRSAALIGITKGVCGTAGELKGTIGNEAYGKLCVNCDGGVYGSLLLTPGTENLIPVALAQEVRCGPAQIVTTVENGDKQYYDVEIVKINHAKEEYYKNMVVKVTDPELIEMTGGIVQGMSGSPILQDGMLVGAVTHVFLNDPLKGYGIFAENMLALSDSVQLTTAA